jgi:hypothetical protein
MTNWQAHWQEQIDAAQQLTAYLIDGKRVPRTAHDGAQPCRDCAVTHGQLHVPPCCVERCPGCGAQAITCECNRGYN